MRPLDHRAAAAYAIAQQRHFERLATRIKGRDGTGFVYRVAKGFGEAGSRVGRSTSSLAVVVCAVIGVFMTVPEVMVFMTCMAFMAS